MSFHLIANPIEDPEEYDFIWIGSVKSPGIAKVTTPGIKYLWDKKKGPGTSKRALTFRGIDGSDAKIKFLLWEADHFADWIAFQGLFEHDPTKKKVKAIEVEHPALVALNLRNFVCEGIGPIVEEGHGLYSVTVELTEYSPPPKKNVTSTPKTIARVGGTDQDGGFGLIQRDTVSTIQSRKIDELMNQAGLSGTR